MAWLYGKQRIWLKGIDGIDYIIAVYNVEAILNTHLNGRFPFDVAFEGYSKSGHPIYIEIPDQLT